MRTRKQPRAYSTWWISGQYVNTFGNDPGYTGCQGGPVMSVDVGDTLNIDMALAGTVWTQTVTDVQTGQSVSYSLDMMNQAQNLAYFVIEEYSSAPVSDGVFTDTTITFGSPDGADCKLTMRGQNDYVSVPSRPATDAPAPSRRSSCARKEFNSRQARQTPRWRPIEFEIRCARLAGARRPSRAGCPGRRQPLPCSFLRARTARRPLARSRSSDR